MERALPTRSSGRPAYWQRAERVAQETLGWDEADGATYCQRSKEEAHDYRYFPEPDLPPLVVDEGWLARIRAGLPELPRARALRYQHELGLSPASAAQMAEETEDRGLF